MKKELYIFAIFLAAGLTNVIAQPAIDALYDFEPGMTYSYFKIPTGTELDTNLLPTIGANLTWNLDLLPWESEIQYDSIYTFNPASNPSAFESCTFVYKEYGGYGQFYRKSNDTLFYMGNVGSNGQFEPNAITMIYPTTYQSSGYKFYNYETHVPWNDTWTYSGRYNAYGTVIIGGGSYTDVALYVIKGGKTGQFYVDYMWVQQGHVKPLARIQFQQSLNNFEVNFAYGLASAILGISDEVKNTHPLKLYPNPSNGEICIESDSRIEKLSISQFDIHGKKVASKSYGTFSGKISFELQGERGMYFMEFKQGEKNIEVLKVIKS